MSPESIAQLVAEEMGYRFEEVISESRESNLVKCRRWIALILHEKAYPVPVIAGVLHRERTTILHHLELIRSFMAIYPQYKKQYQELTHKIHENQAYQKSTGRHSHSPQGDAGSYQAG